MVRRIEQLNNAIKEAVKIPGYKEMMSELGPKVLKSLSEGRGFSGFAQDMGGGLTPEQQAALSNFDQMTEDLMKKNADKFKDGMVLTDPSFGSLKSGGSKSGAGAATSSGSGFGDWGGSEGGASLIGDLNFNTGGNRGPASDADADSIHLSQNRSIFKIVSDRIAVKAKDKAILSAQDAKAAAATALKSKSRTRLPASTRGKQKTGTL